MAMLLKKGDILIGMMHLPGRTKPCLVIQKGNAITKYASFNNEQASEEFMFALADFVDAERDCQDD